MTLEAQIYSRLSGYSALTDIVSTRISQLRAPANEALPDVVFTFVDHIAPGDAMGATGTLRVGRLQVDCYADDITDAQSVADQAEAALLRYSTSTGTLISDIFLDARRDLTELEDMEDAVFRVSLDFRVNYNK
jgi:hypothetical protein